jgi:hypothetical protein
MYDNKSGPKYPGLFQIKRPINPFTQKPAPKPIPFAAVRPAINPFAQQKPASAPGFPNYTKLADPAPAPGPAPTASSAPNMTPAQFQKQPSGNLAFGMVDPGVLAAQQAKAQNDKQNVNSSFADPGLLQAEQYSNQKINKGFADYGQLQAELWDKTLHPDLYPNSKYVDLTPNDDGKKNTYGIDINEFLRWAYSQLGYREKATNENLDDKFANPGTGNYTKYGKWYDDYFKTSGFNGDRWCAAFASWCAYKAGITDDQIYKRASTQLFIDW